MPRVSAARRRIMAAIRGKNTKPELQVRRAIHASGLRFRLHHRELPGSPDVVLSRIKTVVFVHGCFWHAHSCQRSKPKTRAAFWQRKFEANQARDRRVRYFLRSAGWHVHVIWECELKREAPLRNLVRRLRQRRDAQQ
ncbi:MAG: very short patch repair endonuclease [Gemmatimonas sp.]|nr:very short patch repair endonuclease [Gemmatimonas sp.]